ncbi:hypothetical protein [Nannocystis pusilla]|uniref:Uncharacterized protein n=1 Tax=Nannocystis pusilla TaxID=889268 RepID=A0ABS7TPE9_9BACT|nr:hypothetical protein [Nannocystis pusilla]MBZ5710098.1 hypothetical protein [Nannocystis pusilla]
MTTVDYLNVSIHGYACELFVNGAPILRTPVDTPYTAIPSVGEWLVSGDNEIAVRIDAIAPPTAIVDPLSPRRLIVQRCVGPLGEVVPAGEDQVVDGLTFAPLPDDPPPTLPHRVAYNFRLPPGPTWAWQTAAVLSLDMATTAELFMFLDALHADLVEGDIPGLLSRQKIKFAELAPLYGTTPEAARAALEQQFSELAKDGAWTVAPLRHEEVRLHLCCGGRVIEPRSARDDGPVFRGLAADGNAWSLPVFISRIDGMFEVVR